MHGEKNFTGITLKNGLNQVNNWVSFVPGVLVYLNKNSQIPISCLMVLVMNQSQNREL